MDKDRTKSGRSVTTAQRLTLNLDHRAEQALRRIEAATGAIQTEAVKEALIGYAEALDALPDGERPQVGVSKMATLYRMVVQEKEEGRPLYKREEDGTLTAIWIL